MKVGPESGEGAPALRETWEAAEGLGTKGWDGECAGRQGDRTGLGGLCAVGTGKSQRHRGSAGQIRKTRAHPPAVKHLTVYNVSGTH